MIWIIFFCFLGSLAGFCQTESFLKAYGNTGYDFGRDIVQDNDSGYVITGSSSSFGPDNGEAYLLKLNTAGEFSWSRNYGGEGSEWGEGLVVTNDSTYAIAGYTNSYGAGGFDFYLIRIDATGEPIWQKTFGGTNWDKAFALVQLADSGFVLVGDSYSFEGGIQRGYIVRTDKNGELLWEKTVEGPMPSFFTDVALDGDSIVICGGKGDGGVETFDGLIQKYHIDGTFGWEKTIGKEFNDFFSAIYSSGGYYSLGGTRSYTYPLDKENMWMYRTDDIGNEIIDTVYVNFSPNIDGVNDITVRDFDQDYYFVGHTKSYGYLLDGFADIFVGKMTATEIHLTANTYGEKGTDIGQAIAKTRDGGVVFLCDTEFFATGGHNILVIKLNYLWDYPGLFDFIEYDDITTSVEEIIEKELIEIYPNPFQDIIFLPEIETGYVSIFGLDGKLVTSKDVDSNQVNLSELSKGIYVLSVTVDNILYQKRIVKN